MMKPHQFAIIALHSIKHIAPHQSNTGVSFTIFFFLNPNNSHKTSSLFACSAVKRNSRRKKKLKSSVNSSVYSREMFSKKNWNCMMKREHRNEKRKWTKMNTRLNEKKKYLYNFKKKKRCPLKNCIANKWESQNSSENESKKEIKS